MATLAEQAFSPICKGFFKCYLLLSNSLNFYNSNYIIYLYCTWAKWAEDPHKGVLRSSLLNLTFVSLSVTYYTHTEQDLCNGYLLSIYIIVYLVYISLLFIHVSSFPYLYIHVCVCMFTFLSFLLCTTVIYTFIQSVRERRPLPYTRGAIKIV
jgi:hypothetical protein